MLLHIVSISIFLNCKFQMLPGGLKKLFKFYETEELSPAMHDSLVRILTEESDNVIGMVS